LFQAESILVRFEVNQVPQYYTPFNDDIYIAGSFNSWSPNAQKLNKISNSLYRIDLDLASGRHEYKFTRGSWSAGECNSDGSVMANRVLSLTSSQTVTARILNWDDFKGRHTASGNVHIIHSKFTYKQFSTTKRIWIYLPPDYYTSSKNYSVLYMSDAQNLYDDYFSFAGEWGVDEAMQTFYQLNKKTSIIVGLETTTERMSELTPYPNPQYGGGLGDRYVDFLINDLKPYIDQNFRTLPQREFTGIAGSSLGGLMSFYAGIKNQLTFSRIGVFSPSFWFNDRIYSILTDSHIKFDDTRIYFVCGGSESSSMVPDMTSMVNLARLVGYRNVNSVVKSDGQHSEWFWRREFPASYEWLFA
jgi:predicted alpha/beta superfamily hydrolase